MGKLLSLSSYNKYIPKGHNMKKILLPLLFAFGFSILTYADTQNVKTTIKPISENQIKQMDRQFTKHKAIKRNFKTDGEFKQKLKRKIMHKNNKYITSKSMHYNTNGYSNGYNYNNQAYKEPYRPIRQRGYRYTKRGWILAYRYDRASFYDNQGYYYGYFNRFGYYFEEIFYSYDRYYTYRDRIRGRGLFDNRYYMPANASYYGFCETRRPIPRPFRDAYGRGSYNSRY
jgi:hypothetical protein